MILGYDSMKPLFFKGLKDPSAAVRCAAINAWKATGLTDEGLISSIIELLTNDESKSVRETAATYFYDNPIHLKTASDELHTALESCGSNPDIYWKIFSALGITKISHSGLQEIAQQVYKAYGDSLDPDERAAASAAAGYLASLGDSSYKQILIKYLQDEDMFVQAGAIPGMQSFVNDPHMMAELCNTIEREGFNRQWVFRVLQYIAPEMKIDTVRKACSRLLDRVPSTPENAHTRLYAGLSLAALGNEKEGFSSVYALMMQNNLNIVFYREAYTALCRTSGKSFPYDVLGNTTGQEWETYINSLSQ
jgi:hypothetical protein